MYSTILYPTDGSDNATAALKHVRDLAEKYDATVHVLTVVDTASVGLGLGSDPQKKSQRGMGSNPKGSGTGMSTRRGESQGKQARERANEITQETANHLGDVKNTTAVTSGTPHRSILEYADGNDIDLIVMGTHGRTGVERYLLGSVTEKVIRLSDVPVVTVRTEA